MEKLALEKFLRFHSKNIQNEKCVLFLGPLFGATRVEKNSGKETEEPIYKHIRAGLNEYYSKEYEKKGLKYEETNYLDCQFDNLFILKNARKERSSVDITELRFLLSELYQSLTPTAMYEQIARLPLNAIITCTPDLLLRNTFLRLNVDHDFYYYSPKQQRDRPIARNSVPIIYNLFGKADDTDSFIITHEAFFKFVFTMLGDNEELPVPLRNIIINADLFVMLGFDLSKWYIPLLMRRLNEDRNRQPHERESIFNNAAEYTDDDDEKISAKILVLEDAESPSEVIDRLMKEIESQQRLRPINMTAKPKVVLISASARALIEEDKLNESIGLLVKLFDDNRLDKNTVSHQAGRLAGIDTQKNLGTLDNQEYQRIRNEVRMALLKLCDELDQAATVETIS